MTKNIEDATIIPPKAVAEYSLKDAALQELSKVEAGLGELKTDYAGKVYEVTNALGMAQAKQARMTIREIRYRIPKIIDEKKALIKAAIKEMEASGAKITEELFALENPIHDQIKAEEDRVEAEKERKREEARLRLQKITESIEKIKLIPVRCAAMNSEQLTEQIAFVEAIQIGEDFYGEFRPSATDAKTAAYQELVDLKNVAVQLEQETAERLQREKEEREEQERLQEEERQRLAEQQKELARQQAEFAEQKRLQDIEAARLKQLADNEAAKLAAERAAFEEEQKAVDAECKRRQKEEDDKREAEEAEQRRVQKETEDKKREEERLAAVEADRKAKEAEKDRKAAEKAKKLALAKLSDSTAALKKILSICEDHEQTDRFRIEQIAVIAEANI